VGLGAVASAPGLGAALPSGPANGVGPSRGSRSGRVPSGRPHRVRSATGSNGECLAAAAAGAGTPVSCPTVRVEAAETASGPGVLARTGVTVWVLVALGAILLLAGGGC